MRLIGAVAALALVAVTAERARAAEELNLLAWCDHTDPNLLEPFEKANNVKINVKEYDGTGTALALLDQSQPGDWDVFVVDSVDVARVAKAGWLAALDPKTVPFDDMFEQVRAPQLHTIDGKLYAAPEKFGYNVVAYDKAKVDPADMRKADVAWNAKYKGRLAVYDYYIPVMNMVAIGLGMKPDQTSLETLPKIRDALMKIKPLTSAIGDVTSVQTALTTGEADIIVGGGEFVVAGLHKDKPNLDWVLPDAGGVRWMQAIGVFEKSKRKPLATKFLQYILGPEGQARLATSSCYWAMPTNRKAALNEEQKKTLRWDEQPGFVAKSYPYFIPDEKLDAEMQKVWAEFLQK